MRLIALEATNARLSNSLEANISEEHVIRDLFVFCGSWLPIPFELYSNIVTCARYRRAG
jgi:hypothetical protein